LKSGSSTTVRQVFRGACRDLRGAGQAEPHEIKAIGVACDVSKEEAVKSAFDKVIEEFGRIDVLV
jgi:NAD(P)-dependent dehydrogenase (short-subunit alcohol dehydrogenase family)